MLMAALGAIRGNLAALEAALRAIDDEGIHTVVHTGDSVVGGGQPAEVLGLLRARAIPSVQGESDRDAARFARKEKSLRRTRDPETFEALRRAYESLRSDDIEYLAGLPRQRALTVDGVAICLCHGTPFSQAESLEAEGDPSVFRRVREAVNTDIVVCGREPTAFARWVDAALFVNPGPAAIECAAAYAIIDTECEPWKARFERVSL